jgi:TPR repeat protein
MLKRVLAGLFVAVMMAGAAVAGPWEDAAAAHQRGDYATELKLWTQLADQSDAGAQNNLGLMYANGTGVAQCPSGDFASHLSRLSAVGKSA